MKKFNILALLILISTIIPAGAQQGSDQQLSSSGTVRAVDVDSLQPPSTLELKVGEDVQFVRKIGILGTMVKVNSQSTDSSNSGVLSTVTKLPKDRDGFKVISLFHAQKPGTATINIVHQVVAPGLPTNTKTVIVTVK